MARQSDEQRHGLPAYLIRERFRSEIEEAWHRSELGAWMTTHYIELARILENGSMLVDWADVAESFQLAGLRDVWGRFPSRATAEETWRRVSERQAGRTARVGSRRPA